MGLFDNYEEIESKVEITIADNGYVLTIQAKERSEVEDKWASDYSFVFTDNLGLHSALDQLKEVV